MGALVLKGHTLERGEDTIIEIDTEKDTHDATLSSPCALDKCNWHIVWLPPGHLVSIYLARCGVSVLLPCFDYDWNDGARPLDSENMIEGTVQNQNGGSCITESSGFPRWGGAPTDY